MNAGGELGKVVEWNDARGYGFVQPLDDGPRRFFHIRDYRQDGRRPELGELVRFTASQGADARPAARALSRAVSSTRTKTAKPAQARAPRQGWSIVWIALALHALLLGLLWHAGRLPLLGIGASAGLSLAALLAYANDKRAAQAGQRRTPETSLHLLELLGGWPGALLAQRWLRHKNRKRSYQVVFWACVLLHEGALLTWARLAQGANAL